MMKDTSDELARLRAENARLVALLDTHGIAWRGPDAADAGLAAVPLRTDEKVLLFRRLFRGRADVYPVRWESQAGKTGYSPACANEWRAGVCEKPRIKCADCGHRQLMPLTDQTIYDHLAGRHTIGVYPLLATKACPSTTPRLPSPGWWTLRNSAAMTRDRTTLLRVANG